MTNDINTLDFVAFDTETTGLSASSESLVEIAAVRFNLLNGATESLQSLINPGKAIPPMATRVHGISDDMVFEAPSLDKVLPQFFQFLEGAIPVAHNAPFDIGFISLHSLRHGIFPPEMPILDSCQFSRRVQPEFASHKLERLVQQLNLPVGKAHRALADAKSCMELFRVLVGKSCGVNASWEELVQSHGKLHSFLQASRPIEQKELQVSLDPLIDAIQARRSLWMRYDTNYNPREVTPHMLYAKEGQQYLEATCHYDGVRKNFLVHKIRQFLPTPASKDFS